MHSIEIHEGMNRLIRFFYRIGFWHKGDTPTTKERAIKLFYCVYFFLLVISSTIGAISNENVVESVFLAEVSIVSAVLSVKLWCLMWKQNRIQDLLQVCVFSVRNDGQAHSINKKLGRFIKFVIALFCAGITASCFGCIVVPLVKSERAIILKFGFPLDWLNSGIAFWIANALFLLSLVIAMIAYLFSATIWYIMLNYSVRYGIVGDELRQMGEVNATGEVKISDKEKQNHFLEDLKASIDIHLQLTKYGHVDKKC